MVISSHIVTTLMKRSTHKRQARITITHKILKWECVGTWKSNSDYVVTSKDCCNNTNAYLKKWSIMVLEQCGGGLGKWGKHSHTHVLCNDHAWVKMGYSSKIWHVKEKRGRGRGRNGGWN